MKAGDCVLQIRGYLLKRNKEHRKANLLGAKYKRRWVELTADTLVYAKSQQELLSGGKIEVFSLRKLIWVRRDGDAKFQVKFPERVLVFKVEVGGSTERDRWVAVLEQAKDVDEDAQRQRGNSEKLEQLKKEAEELLLDAKSSDGSLSSIPAHRAALPAAGRGLLAESINGQAGPGSRAGTAGLGSALVGLAISTSSSRTTETGALRLSPRSLLASAKAGSAFVSSTNPAGSDTGYKSKSRGTGVVQLYDDETDGSEDDSQAAAKLHGPVVRAVSLDLARNSLEAAKPNDRAGSSSDNSSSTSPAAAAAASQDVELSAGSGSATPTRRQERRASLQRRLTPGVMLISPSSLPSLDATSTAQQPEAASAFKLSAGNSTCSTPRSQWIKSPRQQPPPAQLQQCSPPTAAIDEDLCDEILRLDSNDVGAYSNSTSASPAAQAALSPGIQRSMEASARPGSAPQYRPGTPLKSCLRESSANNSSCSSSAGNSQQLLSCSGSYSTPASSAEAAAAAAAAVASLGLHRSAGGASSPLSKGLSSAQQHHSSIQAAENITGDEGWIQDDWDAPSDDDGDESSTGGVSHAALHPGLKHCVEGRFGPVAKGSKSLRQHIPGSPRAGATSSTMVKGVAADGNWLDEDFDD